MGFCELSSLRESLLPTTNCQILEDLSGKAAVLVGLSMSNTGIELLLTRRALNLSHHSDEVAFPGGMWEEGDHFPVATALREAYEEVAIEPHKIDILGLLPAMPTRNETWVTPVVGIIPQNVKLVANEDEIASIFHVPLEDLLPDNRVRTDVFERYKQGFWAPAYDFQGHEIWGFTAAVIKIMLEQCFEVEFVRDHFTPEKIW